MKRLLVVITAVAIAAGGLFVYKAGWFSRGVAPTKPVTGAAETAFGAPAASVPGGSAAAPQATPPAGAFPAAELPEGNLASADVGATIELATSEYNWLGASRLLAKNEAGRWSSKALAPDHTFPLDIVVSFFARQPALVGAVRVNPAGRLSMARSTKDVEVWTSMDGPTSGFTKIASATLRNEDVDQTIAFDPVEARYVKLRILSNYGDPQWVECAKFAEDAVFFDEVGHRCLLPLVEPTDQRSQKHSEEQRVEHGGRVYTTPTRSQGLEPLVLAMRHYWLLLAESHLTQRLFGAMLQRIWALPVPTG